MSYRSILAVAAILILASTSAQAFNTTCKLPAIAKDSGEVSSVITSPGGGRVTIKQSGENNTASVTQSAPPTEKKNQVAVFQSSSQGKKIDLTAKEKRTGKLEFYQSHKKYNGESKKVYVPIPQGMDMEMKNMTIYISITGEGTIDSVINVSDNPPAGVKNINSLKISKNDNACEITVTPPVKGEIVFDVLSDSKVLLKVGGNY